MTHTPEELRAIVADKNFLMTKYTRDVTIALANNADGWSVGRAASRDDLSIVDAALTALKGGQNAG
jgi:hypothetical protein